MDAYIYLFKKQKLVKTETVEYSEGSDVGDELLQCLEICQKWDLPRPMIMKKHTRDFEAFGRAIFKKDDFVEHFPYDRLEVEAAVRAEGIPEDGSFGEDWM